MDFFNIFSKNKRIKNNENHDYNQQMKPVLKKLITLNKLVEKAVIENESNQGLLINQRGINE